MTKQPKALRLAQELDAYHKQAAAELRRQHVEIEALRAELSQAFRRAAWRKRTSQQAEPAEG